MMFRQLKVGERLQPFTGTTGQGQAAMLVIAVVDSSPLAKMRGLINRFGLSETPRVVQHSWGIFIRRGTPPNMFE